jgi:hypothetical protein
MNSGLTDYLIASVVPLFLLATSCVSSGSDTTPTRYQSPKAVFDAYREAHARRDARTIFSLLTPHARDDAVFESLFSCMERQGADAITGRRSEAEEIGRIVGKYFDSPAAENDYNKQYKKKHGTGPKTSPHDDQSWYDVVTAHVKDKAGLVEAVAKHFEDIAAKRHEENPISPLGDLENLVVRGDTATGSAKETILRRIASGESPPKAGGPPSTHDKPFKFRRVNGGWLLDSL